LGGGGEGGGRGARKKGREGGRSEGCRGREGTPADRVALDGTSIEDAGTKRGLEDERVGERN